MSKHIANALIIVAMMSFGVAHTAPKHISFQETLDRALLVSLPVRLAKADVDITTATRMQTVTNMTPTLRATLNNTKFDSPVTISEGGNDIIVRPDVTAAMSVTLTQKVTELLALIQQTRANTASIRASQAGFEIAQRNIAFLSAEVYRRVQQSVAEVSIAQARLELSEKQLRDGEARMRAQLMTKIDILRLQMEVSRSRVELAKARANELSAMASLRDLLDYEQFEAIEVDPLPAQAKKENFNLAPVQKSYDDAISTRLEIKKLKFEESALSLGSALPFARYLPEASVFFRYDRILLGQNAFANPTTTSIGINLDWMIWDGGGGIFAYQSVSSSAFKVRLQAIEKQRNIAAEVESTRAQLLAAVETLTLTKASSEEAREAYKAIETRFRYGDATVTDLLLVQSDLISSQLAAASAIADLDIRNMNFQKAMGLTRPESLL